MRCLIEKGKIRLSPGENDNADLLMLLQKIINGAIVLSRPGEIFVVHIDHWFGDRWIGFSGKGMGALGIRKKPPTVPPFHPDKVIWQEKYVFDDTSERVLVSEENTPIHLKQVSWMNLNRFIERLYPRGAFFWISGNSRIQNKGSLMAYLPTEEDHWLWYLDFAGEPWRIVKYVGIGQEDIILFMNRKHRGQGGNCGVPDLRGWF